MMKKIPAFLTRKPACIPLMEPESQTGGNLTCYMALMEQAEAVTQSEKTTSDVQLRKNEN